MLGKLGEVESEIFLSSNSFCVLYSLVYFNFGLLE